MSPVFSFPVRLSSSENTKQPRRESLRVFPSLPLSLFGPLPLSLSLALPLEDFSDSPFLTVSHDEVSITQG